MYRKFESLGVKIPEILLPAEGTDLTKWAVIACDQYTSQPNYWENVRKEVGSDPSTLNMIFPEIYLKDEDRESRIENINKTMRRYLDEGILKPQKPGFILVDRSTPCASSRKGLIIAVDLECYDYTAGSRTLIRATEGTVLDRIPPRVKIRENADIELPHIMVLIDDPGRTIIEKLYERKEKYKKLYDFELMQGGGHIKGWMIDDDESMAAISDALEKLAEPEAFAHKYGLNESGYGSMTQKPGSCESGVLLFAAGDGNHSLATAKAHWENVKAKLGLVPGSSEIKEHPARYALVELVNVHDDGLVFEPIHRVLFGIKRDNILNQLKNACKGQTKMDFRLFPSREEMQSELEMLNTAGKNGAAPHIIPFILEGAYGLLIAHNPSSSLEVGTLQAVLDELAREAACGEVSCGSMETDYIHGEQTVTELGSKAGCMGFYLPAMSKHDLFRTVMLDGVLPRKTFSMGEAEEKRYYLECRRIK